MIMKSRHRAQSRRYSADQCTTKARDGRHGGGGAVVSELRVVCFSRRGGASKKRAACCVASDNNYGSLKQIYSPSSCHAPSPSKNCFQVPKQCKECWWWSSSSSRLIIVSLTAQRSSRLLASSRTSQQPGWSLTLFICILYIEGVHVLHFLSLGLWWQRFQYLKCRSIG